jgi:hypothetical protein
VGKGTLTTWKILRVAFNLLLEAFPRDNRLHRARFAKTHEVAQILSPAPRSNALLLGTRTGDIVAVSPTKAPSAKRFGRQALLAPLGFDCYSARRPILY